MKRLQEVIAPLVEAGRLGALLLQFPWSFKKSPENRHNGGSGSIRWCRRYDTTVGLSVRIADAIRKERGA